MLGIAIHCIQHSQAMLERGVCELAHSFFHLQITEASTYSCAISKQTVRNVTKCPETEDEWEVAAKKKNCSALAHNCNDPDKLVYHCVVNPYVNETLEVCAIRKNIIGGKEMFQLNHLRHSGVVILYQFISDTK